jgi:hypothetical protein
MARPVVATATPPGGARRAAIALLPGTYFGVSNFIQHAYVMSGFASSLVAAGWFLAFAGTFNLFALALAAGWAADRRAVRSRRAPATRILMHAMLALALGTLHLAMIACVVAALRSGAAWQGAWFTYFHEIWVSCVPIWARVYAGGIALPSFVDRGAREGSIAPTPPPDAPLLVRHDRADHVNDPAAILLVEAMGDYSRILTDRGEFTPKQTLSAIESRLPREGFTRVHRSALVRSSAITAIQRLESGAYQVVLAGGTTAPLSRRRLADVRQQLGRVPAGV